MKMYKTIIDVRLPQKQKDELFNYLRKWSGCVVQKLESAHEILRKAEGVIAPIYGDFYITRIRLLRCGVVFSCELVGYGCDEPFAILSVKELEL